MSLTTAEEVYERVVKSLPEEEQRRLVEKITSRLPVSDQDIWDPNRPSLQDLRGRVPYPMFGEDAQQYISRTRREGDEHRERLLRPPQ